MKYNYTTFYTKGFEKHLCDCEGIIYLNIGDKFIDDNGDVYEIIWKMFNAKNMIMVYHGKFIVENLK